MITYNPKDWITVIFQLHKSDTVRKLFPMMVVMGLYSWLVAYIELNYLKLSYRDQLKNLSIVHNLLGFVISLLLVFRTNTAYERWWEGRKMWGGLVNSSRNLAIKIQGLLAPDNIVDRTFFARVIPLYAQVLRAHLHLEKVRLSLDDQEHPELKMAESGKHLPNRVARALYEKVMHMEREGKLSPTQTLSLQTELQSFTDICGACERIKNTPIPFSYSLFIKKFIFFYVLTLPLGFVFSMGYYIIPVVIFVFYVLTSIELIAEEIEDPFGGDTNDLPLSKISDNIQISVREILE